MSVPSPTDPRDRMVLGLDVGGLPEAEAIAALLGEWFGTVKVGFELYAEAGPAAFDRFHELGYRVFADLKLHDIPNTVGRAATVLGRYGVEFLNFHAAGGVDMLRAGVEGVRAGARDAGHAPPIALAVTVLTSEPDASAFDARLQDAVTAGCDGVVCSAHEVRAATATGMRTMVPGIRPTGTDVHDQARVSTPEAAIRDGATWLVIGRAVTAAPDPAAAAAALAHSVRAVLAAPTV